MYLYYLNCILCRLLRYTLWFCTFKLFNNNNNNNDNNFFLKKKKKERKEKKRRRNLHTDNNGGREFPGQIIGSHPHSQQLNIRGTGTFLQVNIYYTASHSHTVQSLLLSYFCSLSRPCPPEQCWIRAPPRCGPGCVSEAMPSWNTTHCTIFPLSLILPRSPGRSLVQPVSNSLKYTKLYFNETCFFKGVSIQDAQTSTKYNYANMVSVVL